MIRNPVTIEPIVEDDIEVLRTVAIKPFQKRFCDQPTDILCRSEEGVSVHVIKKEGTAIGMFCIDTRFHFGHAFAQSDTPGIHSFVIDQAKQGQGLGTETCRMMKSYLRGVAPRARGTYLMVHIKNTGAYKSCIRGGWADTGKKYMLGLTGPQHILWMPIQ